MSVFLIGGGWSDERAPEVFGGLLAEAASRAGGRRPVLGLILMGTDAESLEYHERYVHALGIAGEAQLSIERVPFGQPCPAGALDDVDALMVGGGPTPDYHESLSPLYGRIHDLVAGGLPYAGFSAGAAIAATTAVIGGWRIGDVVICPEETNEELGPVTVVEGIGLVEGAVDVHAAQWGTLGRLVSAVEAGLVVGGVAIDECTTMVVGEVSQVVGAGRVWRVARSGDGVAVSTSRAR